MEFISVNSKFQPKKNLPTLLSCANKFIKRPEFFRSPVCKQTIINIIKWIATFLSLDTNDIINEVIKNIINCPSEQFCICFFCGLCKFEDCHYCTNYVNNDQNIQKLMDTYSSIIRAHKLIWDNNGDIIELKKKICKYGINCKYNKSGKCFFDHTIIKYPTLCRYGNECYNKDTCRYTH